MSTSSSKTASIDPLIAEILQNTILFLQDHIPVFAKCGKTILETIFTPREIGKQMLLALALELGFVTIRQASYIIKHVILSRFSSRQALLRNLKKQLSASDITYDEFMQIAEQIDAVCGNDIWRNTPECPFYDASRITARTHHLLHQMTKRDKMFELLFELRGGIGRNKFGLLHPGLFFAKAMAGTKLLVESYHQVVCAALEYICDAPCAEIPTDVRLAFFNETRHAYGRTALLLSGGAALGIYHVGVVKALVENNVMPRVIGGSSAGSIVSAMVATRTDDELIDDMFRVRGTHAPGHSGRLQLNFFRPMKTTTTSWNSYSYNNNSASAFCDDKQQRSIFAPFYNIGCLFYDIITGARRFPQDFLMQDTEHFRECCRINIGDFTFQEAFDRTGRILNITVTPTNSSDPPRLLNYLTAPHVLIWSGVVASSSLPGVFESNRLLVRDADGTIRFECSAGGGTSLRFADGSMEQDLPMQQLSEMFNVNHFIISQANPHAVWFETSYYNHHFGDESIIWNNDYLKTLHGLVRFLKNSLKSWIEHVVRLIGTRRIAPFYDTRRGIKSQIFTQEYQGRSCDISFVPWIGHKSVWNAILHCIYNPSNDEFSEWLNAAEKETWKYIPAIKSHIAEEMTLDSCVQRLRRRILAESYLRTTPTKKLNERVPSFFTTSPSLAQLGCTTDDEEERKYSAEDNNNGVNIMGWGGLGLQGNRSSGSLARMGSVSSGIFIDHESEIGEATNKINQSPGETTEMDAEQQQHGYYNNNYLKTTNMAGFYYRSSPQQDDVRGTKSDNDLATYKAPFIAKSKSFDHTRNVIVS